MKTIREELEALEKGQEEVRKKMSGMTPYNISVEDYKYLLTIKGNEYFLERNEETKFSIDNDNKELAKRLYHYLRQDSKPFDRNKGILICGNFGSGKTAMMRAYTKANNYLAEKYNGRMILYINALNVHKIKEEEENKFSKFPLFIDDIGKEVDEVVDYGTKKNPMIELLARRYENGAITFATSNFTLETLAERYGAFITDRLESMFNIYILKTKKSRRK